jgi:hypothetical protein
LDQLFFLVGWTSPQNFCVCLTRKRVQLACRRRMKKSTLGVSPRGRLRGDQVKDGQTDSCSSRYIRSTKSAAFATLSFPHLPTQNIRFTIGISTQNPIQTRQSLIVCPLHSAQSKKTPKLNQQKRTSHRRMHQAESARLSLPSLSLSLVTSS